MKSNPPSTREAFNFAWIAYTKHIGLFTACMLTFFASWIILEIIVIQGQRFGLILWAVAHIIFFIIFAGMEVGFLQICLALQDGKQVRYADLFRDVCLGFNFLFVQLTYFVSVLVGLTLFIVPGAYLGARYTFYAYTFAEGNANLKQSFQQSAVISRDSMWFLFWFSVLMILLNIVGASVLGIGLLVTVPFSTLIKVYMYRQLKD